MSPLPTVLILSSAPAAGHSWLLRGLPVASVALQVASPAAAASDETLQTLFAAHCHAELRPSPNVFWAAAAAVAAAAAAAVSGGAVITVTAAVAAVAAAAAGAARKAASGGRVWRCALVAVIVEPVSCQTGEPLPAASAATLRRVCDQFDVPLIADETRCGLGRCGNLLCGGALGLEADCTTVGEALGGGYCSVAAVLYDRTVFGR